MKPEQQAAQWFIEGVKKSQAFDAGMRKIAKDFVDAAFCFLRSRELVPHGQWADFCELWATSISPRTVRRWCQAAESAIEWAKKANPGLKTTSELHACAREMMLQSPKGLVALCRDLKIMRPFGEYDAIKYAQKKLSAGQIEFAFDSVFAPLDALAHFGDPKYQFVFPEGKDESTCIAEVKAKLQAALKRVEEIEQHGRVIET